VECLRRTLLRLDEKGVLGPATTLFVQADNCSGENKNNIVLSFLSHLVDLSVFRNIYYNFLLVGHTHCDLDQCYGWIYKKMRSMTRVKTLEEYDEVHDVNIMMSVHMIMNCYLLLIYIIYYVVRVLHNITLSLLCVLFVQMIRKTFSKGRDKYQCFELIEELPNWNEFFLAHVDRRLSGYSQPHHFRFTKDEEGKRYGGSW
jgi:hypothetical protein